MFNFYQVYRVVTSDAANTQFVALGVQETKSGDGVLFIVPGSGERKVTGKIVGDNGGTVEMLDEQNTDESGKPLHYIFEPLTLETLTEMGDYISGLDSLLEQVKSDDDVLTFYKSNFLEDYWVDNYEKGIRHDW
jgi:hypothetical protein